MSVRILGCHYCGWQIGLTEIDKYLDASTAYTRHLARHVDAVLEEELPTEVDRVTFAAIMAAEGMQ